MCVVCGVCVCVCVWCVWCVCVCVCVCVVCVCVSTLKGLMSYKTSVFPQRVRALLAPVFCSLILFPMRTS